MVAFHFSVFRKFLDTEQQTLQEKRLLAGTISHRKTSQKLIPLVKIDQIAF